MHVCILVHIIFTTFSRKSEVTPHFAALVWYFYCMHWFSKSWVLLHSGSIKPLFIVHVWWKWRAGSIIFNQNCTGEFEVGVTSAYTELVLRKWKYSTVQQKLLHIQVELVFYDSSNMSTFPLLYMWTSKQRAKTLPSKCIFGSLQAVFYWWWVACTDAHLTITRHEAN